MLFGYPIEATAENWLHECLVEMLQTVHESIRSGTAIPAWPDIIPEEYRARLRRRKSIKTHLTTYQKVAATLTIEELEQVSTALISQNNIAELLAGLCTCEKLDDLPESVKMPIREIFEIGFGLLTELGIRDRQYQVIFDSMNSHVCPFCGCEYFDAPTGKREDLDHYLAESKYPFAATNLRNLVPMGGKCNSKYKLAKDILFKADGKTRRKSFYPYNHTGIRLSLKRTKPFSGNQGIFSLSEWEIDFLPDSEESETWDDVFHIRERFKRDILTEEYKSWLGAFAAWCRSASVKAKSPQDVIDGLQKYARYMETIGINDRAFLKTAFFQMLHTECEQGNQRVIDILSGLVFGVSFLEN